MSLPLVAVVGRPNVGKSTLINRITQTEDAIVHEMRGVTRDRSYHRADWNGVDFMIIDTGGIALGDTDMFQGSITSQALVACEESDCIIFVVDGRTGVTSEDTDIARVLLKSDVPVVLAVNKLDNPDREDEVLWEFYSLGLGEPMPISASHGHGTGDLLDAVVRELPEDAGDDEAGDEISVAIIGRPNAGKSSLTNRLVGGERSIVSDVAGTTRDAIDSVVEHDGVRYRIVDTAGIRRKSQIDEDVEYYGYVRSLRAIDRADVVLLMIDATLGLTDADQKVAGMAAERDSLAAEYYSASLADGIENHLEGSYNRFNIAAAVAVGRYFDVPDERIRHAIAGYVPDNNRSQRIGTSRNTLVADCYNANPSSMRASVGNFLAEPLEERQRRVLILGDMLELGDWSEREHAAIIEMAAQAPEAELLLVGPEFAKAYDGLAEKPANVTLCPTRDDLISLLKVSPVEHSLVLVKGSHGMGLEQALEAL